MKKTIAISLWATLLARSPAWAQEAPPRRRKRLGLRARGSASSSGNASPGRIDHGDPGHDAGPSRRHGGSQRLRRVPVPISVAARSDDDLMKSVGVEGRAKVETLPDGRYRLNAHFEESSVLAAGGATAPPAGQPILLVVRESPRSSSARERRCVCERRRPVTGEVGARRPHGDRGARAEGARGGRAREARLRARLVLVRRRARRRSPAGPTPWCCRPREEAAGKEAADLFSGSMLRSW